MANLSSVKTWAAKYDIKEELEILLNNGFDNLTSIAFIDEKDLDTMNIVKLGSRKKIIAGVNELNNKIGKLRNMGGSLAGIHAFSGYSDMSTTAPETSPKFEEPTGDALLEYFEVRKAVLGNVPQMCAIYNYYCKNYPELTGNEDGKTEQQFTNMFYEQDERHNIIVEVLIKSLSNYPVGTILGYCNLKKYSDNTAVANVCEFSMYFNKDFKSKGMGMALSLVAAKLLYKNGFEKAIHRISGTNIPSIKITEKLGFVKVATMPQLWTVRGKKEDILIFQKDLLKDKEIDEPRVNAMIAAIHQTVV